MAEASTFTAIDLSRLPAPTAIETISYEAIYAEMVAKVQETIPEFDGTVEGDAAVRVLQVAAYFRMLDRQRVNDAARAVMIAYAEDADLDQLGALMSVPRLTITPANAETGAAAIMENDEDFRRRIVLAPEGFSVAGPTGAYIFHALSADGDVLDASAVSPSPAVVNVYVLSRTGAGTASPELIATVTDALSADTTRPVADRLTVASATLSNYAVVARIWTFAGPDSAVVIAAAQTSLNTYIASTRRLGRSVTRSGLFAALHVAGVQKVVLDSPAADIAIAVNQAPNCTGITLTYEGTGT